MRCRSPSEGDGEGAPRNDEDAAEERYDHVVEGKHGASKVILSTAADGTGVIAGGPMRAVFDVIGIRNIVAKSHGSTNPYNLVRATLNALSKLRTPAEIAAKRGKSVEEVLG